MSDRSELTLNDDTPNDWNGTTDRIVELRARGYSQAVIAKQVGLSVATVAKILKQEFGERNSSRQDLIDEQKATLNWMKKKITDRIHKDGAKWDRRDAELLLKFEERVAKLVGLDQPVKHDVAVTFEDISDAELVEQLAAHQIFVQLPAVPKALPEPVEDAQFTSQEPNVGHQRITETQTGSDPQAE